MSHKKRVRLLKTLFIICSAAVISIGMGIKMVNVLNGAQGPGLTTSTWPAGTFLSHIDRGGRVVTHHRGYIYMHALNVTTVWDVSNPANPVMVDEVPVGDNGHRWWKFNGDLYWREYTAPEAVGSGFQFMDLSNMLNRKPWMDASVPFPIEEGNRAFQQLETFPITIDGNNVNDMKTQSLITTTDFSAAPERELKVRIGNLLLFFGNGAAAYDIGDPKNIKLLDVITGKFSQYTTTVHVWRNYLIFMNGDNSNEGGNNLVAIDFSDPSDLTYAWGTTLENSPGRYMHFQDEYGFTGRQKDGVKLNLETLQVERRFTRPDHSLSFSDFQWIPLGNVIMASGAESGSGQTFFYTHQDELDTRPPSVSYHNPVANATNQPLETVIGFVINETLKDITITDQTVQVRPVDGEPIEGDIVSTSYDVFNFIPKQPLQPDKTYEVKLVQGGIEDVSGNGIEEYTFYFSTGTLSTSTNNSPTVSSVDTGLTGPVAVGSAVTFTVNATDIDGDVLEYRWDFGDNQPKTVWSTSNEITQTFSEAGIYQILAQVRDGKGGIISSSGTIIVTPTFSGAVPTQSSQVMVDSQRRKVWTVNPDNNSVAMIDINTMTVEKEVSVGIEPTSLALDGNGQVWVACEDDDKLFVLSAIDGTLTSILDLPRGSEPYGIVFNPAGDEGFVSLFGTGKIVRVNPATMSLGAVLDVGATPRALAVSGDGQELLVTRFISPDQAGEVWKINLNDFTLESTISLPLDSITVDSGSNGRGLPNYLAGVAISPSNAEAWTVAKKDNIARGLSKDGNALTFETTVRTAISSIDLALNNERTSRRVDIDNHAQPSAITFSPSGSHLFMTMQGNNRVVVLDASNGREVSRQNVGLAPQGIAIDPVSNKVFVKNFMDRSISILDASEMLASGSRNLPVLQTLQTVTTESLSAQVLKGKQIFYNAADERMTQDGYMACATCHIEGTQDGRVWDFTDRGEGLRNTISLKGRSGTGHGRVHWTGNFDEIHDFEIDIRDHFNGKGFMTDTDFKVARQPLGEPKAGKSPDLDALVAYIESLNDFDKSPYKTEAGQLTAQAVSGKTLFQNLECGSCHSGDNFTNSSNGLVHDVGTLKNTSGKTLADPILGLDAPTLRGLWKTAPYLHDGSAETLEEVFYNQNADGGHGNTASLTSVELDELVAYLKQIDGSEPAPLEDMVLEVSSIEQGAQFKQQLPISLQLNTNIAGITKVVYYADNEEIATTSTAPFTAMWTPVKWAEYNIRAKAYYNNGKTATVSPDVNIRYKRGLKGLMVVGNPVLGGGDEVVLTHLEELGFDITVIDDDSVTQQMGRQTDLIFISSSSIATSFGEDLTHIPVPVVTWNPFSYNQFKINGNMYNDDFGYTTLADNSINILKEGHPATAGLTGTVKLYDIQQRIPFGNPTATYVDILAESGGRPVVLGMRAGEGSFRQSRKITFPLKSDFVHLLTDDGWDLFDAAIDWALYGGDELTGLQPLPDVGIISPQNGATVGRDFTFTFFTDNWPLSPGGNQMRYSIDTQNNIPVFSNEPIEVKDLPLGLNTLTVTLARPNHSLTTISQSITVNVVDSVVANPVINITSPVAGDLVNLPFEVAFEVQNWNVTAGGRHIQYFVDGVVQGSAYTIDPIVIGGLNDGVHTVKLQLAEADNTLIDAMSEVSITVSTAPLPNQPPTAVLNISPGFIPENDANTTVITLDASASTDPEGGVLTYEWVVPGATFVQGTSPTSAIAKITFPGTASSYSVGLNIADAEGGTDMVIGTVSVATSSECGFGTPLDTPLATTENRQYSHLHVLGSGGPDLSNVSQFVINWDLQNNGLWQMSMNTIDGQPSWWIDLTTTLTQNFNQVQPGCTITNSGFPGLDGDYWVASDGTNFAMVSQNGGFTIYASNSATPPGCGVGAREGSFAEFNDARLFPNPTNKEFNIVFDRPELVESINVYDQLGRNVFDIQGVNATERLTFGEEFNSGLYLVIISYPEKVEVLKVSKK